MHENLSFQHWEFSSKPVKAGYRQDPKNQGELHRSGEVFNIQAICNQKKKRT